MNPCDDYDFAHYSKWGLGCDRTSAGPGSRMTDNYSPGVREMLDDPARIPPELTLFFHNKRWTDLVPPYCSGGNASSVTLFRRIRDRHAGALDAVRSFLSAWEGLETDMTRTGDAARWAGVKARLEQQLNDATVFSGVIMGYYQELSGLSI